MSFNKHKPFPSNSILNFPIYPFYISIIASVLLIPGYGLDMF